MAATAEVSQQYSTYALVRRLLVDEALCYWPRYAIAFALMGIAAAATALTAYLLGTMTNEAYVNRNFRHRLSDDRWYVYPRLHPCQRSC